MNFAILAVYLLLQFAICIWISLRIHSQDDYLVGGRNLPLYLVTFSLFATWFGAETCIGSSAMVYTQGLSGSRADPFGYSLCLLLSGLLIAPRLWNAKYFTLADLYRDRFDIPTEQIATWILTFSSIIWAAAQLRAFSQVVSATTDLPVDATLLGSFLFVVAYTMLGGLLGDIVTDLIQGLVIFAGLFMLFYFVVDQNENVWQLAVNQVPERLSLVGPNESWLERIDRWAIPILGSLVAQEIVARIFAAKSKKVAVNSCYWASAIYLLAGSVPVFLGLIGPQIMQLQGSDNEQFLIQLAQNYLPWFLVPIFAGALISALLATIDSILLSAAALISNNVIVHHFSIKEEKNKVRISRALVFICGLVAYGLAIYSDSIYQLIEVSASFGTSGILIITMIGLWSKYGNGKSATAALIIGAVATPIGEYVLHLPIPFLFSMACSLFGYIAVSLIYPVPSEPVPSSSQW